jgi:hypothetical protein
MQTHISSAILAQLEPHRTGLLKHQELFEALLARPNVLDYGSRMSEHQFRESMGLFSRLWLCCVASTTVHPDPFLPVNLWTATITFSHNGTARCCILSV